MISLNCVANGSRIGPCDQNVRKHEVMTSKGWFRSESMAFRCRWLQSSAVKPRKYLYLGTFMESITICCSSEVPKQLVIIGKKKKKVIQLVTVISFRKKYIFLPQRLVK